MQHAHLPCTENFSPPNGHLGQTKICVFLNRPNFFRPANEPCHFHCNIGLIMLNLRFHPNSLNEKYLGKQKLRHVHNYLLIFFLT